MAYRRDANDEGAALRAALLAHYQRSKRDLPWRRTSDPYAIWVSEIMLQQTQVDTVTPRYAAFLKEFPTVQALARADETRVCEAWAGLGYYRRARNLHAAARRVMVEHGGRLPSTARELFGLPGIGRYTAGAIASIAFGEEAPVVDGNVARVLSRLHGLPDAPDSTAAKRRLWELAGQLVLGKQPGDLNQALMDLGATLCKPVAPTCEPCPVRRWCVAVQSGDPSRFPASAQRPERAQVQVAFVWIANRRGVWLRRRDLDGLWAGLWEPPSAMGAGCKREIAERLGIQLGRPAVSVSHDLTHRRIEARVYRPRSTPVLRASAALRPFVDPTSAALSALARKAVKAMLALDASRTR